MGYTLTQIFGRILKKQGFRVVEFTSFDFLEFETFYIKGTILFDKPKKYHSLRWRCKNGYDIYDIPISEGGSIDVGFKNASDLLNFLQRRLTCQWKHR